MRLGSTTVKRQQNSKGDMRAAASLLIRKRHSEISAGCGTPFRARYDRATTSALTPVFRITSWMCDLLPYQYACTSKSGMSVDHASAVAATKSDAVFMHLKAGMTVIVTDTDRARPVADLIWVDGGARNPKAPPCFRWPMTTRASSTGSTPTS